MKPPSENAVRSDSSLGAAPKATSDASAASPAILLAMTAVTGIVDAVSYLAMGRVFTANMTGNIVLLGFAFAGASGLSMLRSSVALIAFLAGAVAGGRMALRSSSRAWIGRALIVEALLLALSAALAIVDPLPLYAVIASTAAAMRMRNAVVRKLGVPDPTTTALTLTVTGLAADPRLAGGDDVRWRRRLAAIAARVMGAGAGARVVDRPISVPLAVCSASMA